MAISQVGETQTVVSTANTTFTINVPAGVQNDDLLRMVVGCANAAIPATPSGWSVWRTATTTGLSLSVFYRTASSEPASYTLSGLTSARYAVLMDAKRGVDLASPADVAVSAAVAGTTAVGFNAITPVTAGAWVEGFAAVTYGGGVATGTISSSNLTLDEEAVTAGGTGANARAAMGRAAWTSGAFTPAMTTSATTTRTIGVSSALRPAAEARPRILVSGAAVCRAATR